MKQYIIDTNALVSFVTDRNISQQEKIAGLFQQAARLKAEILCPQNVLTEFVYVLDKVYRVPPETIRKLILDFIQMPGIRVVHEVMMNQVFSFWPGEISDFGDAVIAAVCKAHTGSSVVTFDKNFQTALVKERLLVADVAG